MAVNKQAYQQIAGDLASHRVTLVAVSKTKTVEEIKEVYDLGQRDFGENYVQELLTKQTLLPADIRWHFIGHLQSNKVKAIAPFIHLIQSVDTLKLLEEINKQAKKNSRVIDCLLQVHISQEETKFGFDETELEKVVTTLRNDLLKNIRVAGLMGMASLTGDMNKVRSEFHKLRRIFDQFSNQSNTDDRWSTLSMGMSGDYHVAIEEGSTMVRIGSLIFGARS